MKLLLILLIHPTYIFQSNKRVPIVLLNLLVAAYALVCGMSFQYLYPRLLNNLPFLGFLRKLWLANWNPGFNLDLFFRGLGIGLSLLLVFLAVYWLAGLFGRGKSLRVCYVAAVATCIPIGLTCGIAFGLYYVDEVLGLFPVYGMLVSVFLQAFLMKDVCGLNRSMTIYLSPLVLAGQVYICSLILP